MLTLMGTATSSTSNLTMGNSPPMCIIHLTLISLHWFCRTSFKSIISDNQNCKSFSNRKLSFPNYNSFIDLNGDCRSDLFLMSESDDGDTYFETWISQSDSNTFCLVDEAKATGPVVSLGFTDVNGDSGTDLVYFDQDKDTATRAHIIYNNYPGNVNKPCQAESAALRASPFQRDQDTNIFTSDETNDVTL